MKRLFSFLFLFLVLTMSFIPLRSVYATTIFEETFESGIGSWTTVYASGCTVDADTTYAHHDSYSLRTVIDGAGEYAYAYRTISGQTTVYVRAYVYFEDVPVTNLAYVGILGVNFGSSQICNARARIESGVMKMRFIRYYPAFSGTSVDYTFESDTWYCVELLFVKSATVGEYRFWVNEVDIFNQTSLDTSGAGDVTRILVGNIESATDLFSTYSDCVVVSDTGPIGEEEEEILDMEDFVDNNSSDVDSSSDVGTQSSFTSEQAGPDQTNDTLTEADVPEVSSSTEYFDSYSSDVDSYSDVGTETNPTNAQDLAPDSDYMSLQESNLGSSPENTTLITDGFEVDLSNWDGNGGESGFIRHTGSYTASGGSIGSHSGSYKLLAPENTAGYIMSDSMDMTTATGIYVNFWFYDDDLEPSDLTLSFWDGAGYDVIESLGNYGEDSWLEIDRYDTDNQYFISDFHIRFDFSAGNNEAGAIDDVVIKRLVGGGDDYELDFEYQWTSADYDETTEKVCFYIQTASQSGENLVAYEWNNVDTWVSLGTLSSDGWNNFTASYLTGSTYTVRVVDSDKNNEATQSTWNIDCIILDCSSSSSNYRLDLEEQWTSLTTNYENEELCIYAGPFSGAENLMIQVWHSSSWNWVMNLTANQWNNVSVSSYLDASTFTIRFLDGTQTGDSTQHNWQKDCALLHIWNSTGSQELLYGQISTSITINSAKFVSYTKYADATPSLTIATEISYLVAKYSSVSVQSSVDGFKTATTYKYSLIATDTSVFSSKTWSHTRYATVYQIITVNGWLQKLQSLSFSGDIQPTITLDDSKQFAVIHYGSVDVVCQIVYSSSNEMNLILSINPLFVVFGSYNTETAITENIYGLISSILGVNKFNIFIFDRDGTIDQTYAIATTKDMTVEQLKEILIQMNLNNLNTYELTKIGVVNENLIINGVEISELIKYGFINSQLTINGATLKDLIAWGLIQETLSIDSVTFEALQRYGAINEQTQFVGGTLKDLISSGIVNPNISLDQTKLLDLIKDGLITGEFTVNTTKAVSFNLFKDINPIFDIAGSFENLIGTILNFFGEILVRVFPQVFQNLPSTEYLPMGRGLIFVGTVVGGASVFIIFVRQRSLKRENESNSHNYF